MTADTPLATAIDSLHEARTAVIEEIAAQTAALHRLNAAIATLTDSDTQAPPAAAARPAPKPAKAAAPAASKPTRGQQDWQLAASIARDAIDAGESPARAVANATGRTVAAAQTLISKLRTLGYDIPAARRTGPAKGTTLKHNYGDIAAIATAAHQRGERMATAVAEHCSCTETTARGLISRARQAGHDIPDDSGANQYGGPTRNTPPAPPPAPGLRFSLDDAIGAIDNT